mgnify:FL=1
MDSYRKPYQTQVDSLLAAKPELIERPLSCKRPWQGRVFDVEVSEVALPDGSYGYRELARHHGGAGVCVLCDGNMCLVRQWRISVGRMTLEIPAGKLNDGEDPAVCAARELQEETGLVAGSLEPLATSYGSIGFSDECTHIFLAHDVQKGHAHPDKGEFIELCWVPLDEVLTAVREAKISDSKTIIAALMAQRGTVSLEGK